MSAIRPSEVHFTVSSDGFKTVCSGSLRPWKASQMSQSQSELNRYGLLSDPDSDSFLNLLSYHSFVIAIFRNKIYFYKHKRDIITLPRCVFCVGPCTSFQFQDCEVFETNLLVLLSCQNQFVIKHVLL